jgi:hypothetical protein
MYCGRHGSVNDTNPEEAEHEARTHRDLDALLSPNRLLVLGFRVIHSLRARLVNLPITQISSYAA